MFGLVVGAVIFAIMAARYLWIAWDGGSKFPDAQERMRRFEEEKDRDS